MKKLTLVLLTATALAGCKQQATPAPAPSEAATTAAAAGPSSANGSPAGAYAVTAKDGTLTTTALNADGTYTDSDASGKVVGQGTWAVKDGKTCFMATKGDSGCYTEAAPGADGSFTATSEKGDTVTVKPIVLTAADMAGTYDFMMDGKATTSVMKGDGSYEDSAGGKVTESGTWTANNGKVCFQDTAHKNPEQCWTTTKMDANGKFAATSTDGKTVLQITKQKT
ncbi:MAG TPA: hypothetical protein VL331_07415 [Croceibacterium sp.]|jgi:hypothetical protein|nr:hypothetical protein [Croceibacterium sp.]